MTTFDFLLDTYDTERLKTLSVWSAFTDTDLEFRPAARIRTPHEHMVHQCVSEDTWMKNMLGIDTGQPAVPQKEERVEYKSENVQAAADAVVQDELKKAGGEGGIIGMDHSGNVAISFNTTGMSRGYVGEDGKAVVMFTTADAGPLGPR